MYICTYIQIYCKCHDVDQTKWSNMTGKLTLFEKLLQSRKGRGEHAGGKMRMRASKKRIAQSRVGWKAAQRVNSPV